MVALSLVVDALINPMDSRARPTPMYCNAFNLSPKIISERSTTKNGRVALSGETVVIGRSLRAYMPLIHDALTNRAFAISIR